MGQAGRRRPRDDVRRAAARPRSPRTPRRPSRFLLTYFAPRRGKLTLVFVFAVLSTIFTIVGPKLMGHVTTKLFDGLMSKYMAVFLHKPMPSMDFNYIGGILLLLVGFYLISARCSATCSSTRWRESPRASSTTCART